MGVAEKANWAFMVKVVFGVSLLLTLISAEEKTACMEKTDGKAISHPPPEELGWSDKAEECQNAQDGLTKQKKVKIRRMV